jgi:murein L,D-transpeptidase YafK
MLVLGACTAPPHYSEADRQALLSGGGSDAAETDDQRDSEASALAARRDRTATARAPRPPQPPRADKVVVYKAQRELLLLDDGHAFARYPIALGFNPSGHKRERGDGRTPEGRYVLDWRNPDSRFHRSLHISYPAPRDRRAASRAGRDPGDGIMIHGLPEKYRWMGKNHSVADWTNGCIAVSNTEIERIWRRVPDGTPIVIHP